MKTIDRLIIKAKKKCGAIDLRFSLGMVRPADGGKRGGSYGTSYHAASRGID